MQVCAPVPGSVWSRSTPRKRGAVGRRSAGYWNVNAGCGVYFSVTHSPFSRSIRKIVLKNLMMVCIDISPGSRLPLLRSFSDDDRLRLTERDEPILAQHGAFLANLVL